jgi:hypothetical protein
MKPYRGPPMALSNAASATVRLIVWCRDCGRQVKPDPGEMASALQPQLAFTHQSIAAISRQRSA